MFAASLTQGFVAALHRDGIEEQRALVQIVDVLKLSPPKDYPLPAALYNYHRLILSDGEFILEAIVCPRQGEEKALVKYHLALLKEFSLLRRHSPASLAIALSSYEVILPCEKLIGFPRPYSEKESSKPPPSSTLIAEKRWASLLPQPNKPNSLSDIVLASEQGVKYYCHKLVLVTVSPYFNSLLTGPLGSNTLQEIDVPCSSETLALVIAWCYRREIPHSLFADLRVSFDVESSPMVELWQAAQFFALDELSRELEQKMLDEVFSADNIFDFIEFARKVECHHLQALVCGFFLKHLDVVVNSDRFLKLSAESIHTLLVAGSATNELALQIDIDSLRRSAYMKWSKAQHRHKQNKRPREEEDQLPMIATDSDAGIATAVNALTAVSDRLLKRQRVEQVVEVKQLAGEF